MSERDFKGVWIPEYIWLDSRLSALEKVIMTEIDSLDKGEHGCFASNQYLADFCHCSESKVSKAISKLTSLGYIYVQKFDGRKRELRSSIAKSNTQPSKKCEAESQKMLDTNTDNNTVINTDKKKERKKEDYSAIIDDFTDNEELRETIFEYIKMRKLIKSPMTDRALKMLLKKLSGLSSDTSTQIAMLNEAIVSNWKSVYPMKKEEKRYVVKDAYLLDGIF